MCKIKLCHVLTSLHQGHGGFETAEYISKTLPLQLLQHPPTSHSELFTNLDKTIISNFKADHSIFRRKSPDWIHHAQLIKSGCTALILDIDLNNSISHFSNAGDSRLVICNTLNHQITLQTDDLNTKTASERERLSLEHPNEDSMFINNRLFGRLMSTRGEYIISNVVHKNALHNDPFPRVRRRLLQTPERTSGRCSTPQVYQDPFFY